jgi:hypothetical protein
MEGNAQKHGIYVEFFLEDEDLEEFEGLHGGLIKEWQPFEPTEQRTVFDLAWYFWLQRRNERFHKEEIRLIQQYATERDLANMEILQNALDDVEDEGDARMVIGALPKVYSTWIDRKFPRADYPDTKSWIEALKSLAMQRIMRIQANAVRLELSDQQTAIKKATSVCESMEAKIRRDERIDLQIDRKLKRLAVIRTLKQVIGMQKSETKVIEQKPSRDS